MIKVFLVEDEVVMRNGIKNNIPWEEEGFAFVGEASDGELAYPMILKAAPDILITDIKMPFMDGLALSRIVKKQMPRIKILILSGYDEFDFAKQAIGIGVTEYMLKPVSSEVLLETVKKIAGVIEKEREQERLVQQYQQEMQENILLEREKLFNSLVTNQLSAPEILERGRELAIDFDAPYYAVILFKVMLCGDSLQYSQKLVQVAERMRAFVEETEDIFSFDRATEGTAYLVKGESKEAVEERITVCCKKLKAIAASYEKTEFFGGIGRVVGRLNEIPASYADANKAFSYRFFVDLNQILHYTQGDVLLGRESANIDISSLGFSDLNRKRVDEFLKNGTVNEVDSFIDEYFLSVGEKNYKSLIFRQYIVMDMFICVGSFLDKLGFHVDKLPEHIKDVNSIASNVGSMERVKQYLKELFVKTLQIRDGQAMKKYSRLIEEAKDYIKENFQNNNLSLHMIATKVNISPSYFSTIFSQETGRTFIEYLTMVRLDKAKELLMCSGLKTYEIGYEVGYKDSHYFSYIFKKTQGCTPKEYRMRKYEGGRE